MRHSIHRSNIWITRGLPWLLAALVIGLAPGALAAPCGGLARQSQRALYVPVGRSLMLRFQCMKRVEVVEPTIVEVVVASYHELSIYGKKAGTTTVYVWDYAGLHQVEVTVTEPTIAERAMADLKRLIGPRLTYTAAADRILVLEGFLPAADLERARKIASVTGATLGLQIIDLMRAEDGSDTPAARTAASLRRLLGERLQYVVWNDTTLLVTGTVTSPAELEKIRKLLAATTSKDVTIHDAVELGETSGEPPVADIQKIVGSHFRVYAIRGRTVAIEGTVAGQTELTNLGKVLEAFAGQAKIVNLVQIGEVKPSINETMALLQEIVGNKITVRALGNQALIMEGTLDNAEDIARIRDALLKFPLPYKVVDLLRVALAERRQVLVHVRIVDINKSALEKMGVNWGQLSYTDNTVTFVDQPFLVQTEYGLQTPLTLGAQVDALAQNNFARILSEPNLLVDDGSKAQIQVGGEIPIPVAQSGGGSSGSVTIEWKPYGVLLQIEPQILEGGEKINLKVAPEVSSLDTANAVTISGFVLPAMRSRKASTVVTMPSGHTLMIGGLLQSEDSKAINRLPILGDLPIIGKLFRHEEFQKGQSELVIMVTPEIVQKGAAQPAKP